MRQRFAKSMGGTLRHQPIEPGVATSALVSVYRARDGAAMPVPIEAKAATIGSDGEMSYVLVAANTPDPVTNGNLYRAVWTYTIAGVTYQADQLFEVNARLLKPVVTAVEVARYLPAGWGDLLEGGDVAAEQAIEDGWDDLLSDLVARGFAPDKIMDAERLRQPHRAKVLASLYRSFGPDWLEKADRADSAYQGELDKLAGAVGWYDVDSDERGDDVSETKIGTVVLSR